MSVKRISIKLEDSEQILLNIEALTNARPNEVLNAFRQLFEEKLEQSSLEKRSVIKFGKYSPLADYLANSKDITLDLSFAEIENILGRPLPDSAEGYRAWWANDVTHSQARAWIGVGWQTSEVDLEARQVKFVFVENEKELDYMTKFKNMNVKFKTLGGLNITSNGNEYLECDTSEGTIAVWGSAQNRKNIELLQQQALPCEASISCIPSNWPKHVYWVPELTQIVVKD